jgi:hypothetical protein
MNASKRIQMKVYAITNKSGKVIGTAQFPLEQTKGAPFGGRVTPLPGQKVHELDLPHELCNLRSHEDVARLHNECVKLLVKSKGKDRGKRKDRRKMRPTGGR